MKTIVILPLGTAVMLGDMEASERGRARLIRSWIASCLSHLPTRWGFIVVRHMKGDTLKDIADICCVSPPRVQTIYLCALNRIYHLWISTKIGVPV